MHTSIFSVLLTVFLYLLQTLSTLNLEADKLGYAGALAIGQALKTNQVS